MKKEIRILIVVGKYALALLLGICSAAPKSTELLYAVAPALTVLAPDFGLPVIAVVIGQAVAILLWSHQIRVLPTILLLFIFSVSVKNVNRRRRSVTPGLAAVVGSLVGLVCLLIGFTDLIGMVLYICEAVLSGCCIFFARYYLQAEDKRSAFSVIALMISESAFLTVLQTDDRFLLCVALYSMILLHGRRKTAADTVACVIPVLIGGCMAGMIYLPILLIGLAAVLLFGKYEKYKMLGAFLICTEICTFVLKEASFMPYLAPVAASVLFFLLPKAEEPPAVLPPRTSLSESYASLVQRVDELENRSRITFLPETAKRAGDILQQAGYRDINVTCAENLPGGFFLDVTFYADTPVSRSALVGQMERAAEQSLTLRRYYENDGQIYASFLRKTPFTVCCGAVCKTKNGETVCGDSAIAFGCDDSHYILLLSDGMGSGKDAFMQSRWTVTMLRRLLCAGVGTGGAVSMVDSSLKLGQAEPGYATVDLCNIDLTDGSAKFLKAGAVSTFILRQEEITEVTAVSMPLGAVDTADVAECRQTLLPGDIVVLVSDGALSRKNELLYTLQNRRDLPPEQLAGQLLQSVVAATGKNNDDDITVLVAKFLINQEE